jgi:hypothetical protein
MRPARPNGRRQQISRLNFLTIGVTQEIWVLENFLPNAASGRGK